MTRMKKILLIPVIVICAAIGSYFYLQNTHTEKKPDSPGILVGVSTVKVKNITIHTEVAGTVQAFSTVAIKSRVDGQLMSVNFKEGDTVHAGDVLFTIDPKPYQVALQQAKAKLLSDQAQLDNAKLILQRNATLAQKGYVSSQDFDQFKANLASFEGNVEADKATVAAAQLQLDYCTIVSPIDGRTGNLLVYPGNLIKANDNNPLVTINQIKPVYVAFFLPEQRLAAIQKELAAGLIDTTVIINKNKKSQQIVHGSLSFVDNTVDSTTGMIALKAIFNNTNEHLWPGQFVTIQIPLHNLMQALVIPTQAVQIDQQNKPYVFVLTRDMHAVIRPIKTRSTVTHETIVTEGLQAGEQVVISGQLHLINGAKVIIEANPHNN